MTGSWLDTGSLDEAAAQVVAMLPYAGAALLPLSALRRALGPDTGVIAVELPGHGRRLREPPLAEPEPVVAGVLDALGALAGRRLVLCGYSMGARLGYEVACRLTAAGSPPAGLIACMARAPHAGTGHRPVSHLPQPEFVAAAVDLGLAAPALAAMPGNEPFVRALHADMRIVENFPPPQRVPLRVPAAVIGATADWLAPEPALRAWREVLAEPPLQLRVPGGHLALLESPDGVAAAIARAAGQVLRCAGPGPGP